MPVLGSSIDKKRKMVYVPKACEKQAREWVKTYKEINKAIAKVSKYCLDRLKKE